MAASQKRIPRQCHHRAGYSYVTDPRTKKQVYLGMTGSPEANIAYTEWVQAFLREIAPAEVSPDDTRPRVIGELLQLWLAYCTRTYTRTDGRPTGEVGICARAAELLTPMADRPIRELSRAHLLTLRDELIAQGSSRQTVKHYVSRIIRCWRWGAHRDWVSEDQALRLSQLPTLRANQGKPSKSIHGIPRDHLFRIFRELAPAWRPILIWHLFTGQRVETALSLTVETLDRSRTPWAYYPAQHKGLAKGINLTILVGPRARAALEPFLQEKTSGLVFPGRTMTPGAVYRGPRQYSGYHHAMRTACRRAGVPNYTPRQLRHTAATYLVDRGVSESVIGAILGHTGEDSIGSGSGTITARYAKVPRRRVEATVEKWG